MHNRWAVTTKARETLCNLFVRASLRIVFTSILIGSFLMGQNISLRIDRFQLFNDCKAMSLVVERFPQPEDAKALGLSENAIQAVAVSRLQSARLYTSDKLVPHLYVNVNVVGQAFKVEVRYYKLLSDHVTRETNRAATWHSGTLGTHGNDAGYILDTVSQDLDKFIRAYLRVNEEDCVSRR